MRKDNPLVSIIIACYNGDAYIDECIKALINQSYTNIEIIVCDDASTDNSMGRLQNWKIRDSRIKLLQNEINLFAAASRNKCFQVAQGEYFCIQDIDDVSLSNRIERLLDVIQSEEIDFVSSAMQCFKSNSDCRLKIIRPSKEYPTRKDFLNGISFCHPATMFTRECIEKVGGYRVSSDTRRCQDYDMFMRLYANGYVGKNIPEPLYMYRLDEATKKRGTNYNAALCEFKVRQYGFRALKITPPSA